MKPRPGVLIATLAVAAGLLPFRSATAEDHVIEMKGLTFIPEELQIPVGDSVTWVNHDTDKHDPAAESGEFDSETLEAGQTFSHTFPQPGTFPYFCKVHTYMRGSIVVGDGQAPAGAAKPRPATPPPADPNTTTTTGVPPALVPYPSAITP